MISEMYFSRFSDNGGLAGKKHTDEEGRDIELEDSHEAEIAFGRLQQKELTLHSSDGTEMLNGNVPSAIQKLDDPELGNSTSRSVQIQ